MKKLPRSARFILSFILIFAIFYVFLGIFETQLQNFTARTSAFTLELLGKKVFAKGNKIFLDSFSFEINELCSAKLELALLIAAILSTIEIGRKKRLLASLLAIPAVNAANILRIVLTIVIIASTQNKAIAMLAHELFFRFFLFASIVFFYAAFLRFCSKKK